MKRLILLSIFVLTTPAFAGNKVYFDTEKQMEIVDLSGIKDIKEIEKEFDCKNLIDITQERVAVEEKNKKSAKRESEKEKLIHEEMRDQAVKSLKTKGKLDADGNVKKNED